MKIFFVLLFLLMIVSVNAVEYSTVINVTSNDTSFDIFSESSTVSYLFSDKSTKQQTITLTRSVPSCSVDQVVSDCSNLASEIKARQNYYDMYLACWSELQTSKANLQAKLAEVDYKPDYDKCVTDKTVLTSDNSVCVSNLNTANANVGLLSQQKDACLKELKKETDNNLVFAGLGLLIGAGGFWFFNKKGGTSDDFEEIRG